MKIINISAMWCPSCLLMKKRFKNIMNDYQNLEIIYLDYDIDYLLVEKYRIGKILPVVIFIDDNGIELERLVGEQSEKMLGEKIGFYAKEIK